MPTDRKNREGVSNIRSLMARTARKVHVILIRTSVPSSHERDTDSLTSQLGNCLNQMCRYAHEQTREVGMVDGASAVDHANGVMPGSANDGRTHGGTIPSNAAGLEAQIARAAAKFKASNKSSPLEIFEIIEADIESIFSDTRLAITRINQKYRDSLTHLADDAVRRKADFDHFRQKYGLLERLPYYELSIWKRIFWIIAVLMLEIALNGTQLAMKMETGLGGAIGVTVILSGTMLGLGWMFGRLNSHVNLARSPAGSAANLYLIRAVQIIITLFALSTAIYIAHYRFYMESTPPAGANTISFSNLMSVYERMVSHPFGFLNSTSSALVFLVNSSGFIIGAWKGYTWEDVFPGYKGQDLLWKEAAYKYDQEGGRLREDLNSTFRDATEKFNTASQRAKDAFITAEAYLRDLDLLKAEVQVMTAEFNAENSSTNASDAQMIGTNIGYQFLPERPPIEVIASRYKNCSEMISDRRESLHRDLLHNK